MSNTTNGPDTAKMKFDATSPIHSRADIIIGESVSGSGSDLGASPVQMLLQKLCPRPWHIS